MRLCGDAATATLSMAEFQKVRQLVSVPGMDDEMQRAAGLALGLDRPALRISAGVLRRSLLDLIPDGISGLPDSDLHVIGGEVCVFGQSFHDGIGEAVDGNSAAGHQRLTFWQRNLTALFLKFMWSTPRMLYISFLNTMR